MNDVETVWIPERIDDGLLDLENVSTSEDMADDSDLNSLWRWVRFDRYE